MKVYAVGGAVRDELLGLPVKDRDFVVVGATAQSLLDLGFRPVGKDFPVFLHPQTHEEYALARTERKSGPGYKGFVVHASPEVTLEEDLGRRDLTINAMARAADGTLVDPFGGARDLADRVLRHVGPAFVEDPVRILRVARFAARFDFRVADETLALMRSMTAAGEVDALVPERVWQEIARGLMEAVPSRMFGLLRECGALARLIPELDRLCTGDGASDLGVHGDPGARAMRAVDTAAQQGLPLQTRFAALMLGSGRIARADGAVPTAEDIAAAGDAAVGQVCSRLKVPNECRDLALLGARHHANIHAAAGADADRLLALLARCDAFRRPARLADLLDACACDQHAGSKDAASAGAAGSTYPPREALLGALQAATSIPTAEIAARDPARAAAAIEQARREAIVHWLAERTARGTP